jgi:putative tricarboxylic transport membrane protein
MKATGLNNRIGGLAAAIGGGMALWETHKLYRYRTGLLAGDHVFPGFIGAGLLLCGLLLLIKPGRTQPDAPVDIPDPVDTEDRRVRLRMAAVPAILLAYAVMLPWTGYRLGTLAAAVLLFRLVGGYALWKCLAAGLIATICLDVVFVQWLNTPLPSSSWLHI